MVAGPPHREAPAESPHHGPPQHAFLKLQHVFALQVGFFLARNTCGPVLRVDNMPPNQPDAGVAEVLHQLVDGIGGEEDVGIGEHQHRGRGLAGQALDNGGLAGTLAIGLEAQLRKLGGQPDQ